LHEFAPESRVKSNAEIVRFAAGRMEDEGEGWRSEIFVIDHYPKLVELTLSDSLL
jgi:hypothetical protein